MTRSHLALTGALTLLPLGVLAQPTPASPASPAEPSAVEQETARASFREGVILAQQGRWSEAIARFETALAIRPAPIVRFNLAVACQNTNQFVRAVALYRDYLRDTPREDDPARVDAAAREIDGLARRIARLRVVVTGDQVRAFSIDGRAMNIALLNADIPIDPGHHFIELTGAAGDRTRRDGGFYEGDSVTVEVELSAAPSAAHAAADWQPPTRTFGRQITRPGPGGRWIDWAARATADPVSLWQQRPFTVALQLGYGAPAGTLALSLRYFPQPWFGIELSAGALGALGPSAAATAHLRYLDERLAFGAFLGLGLGRASITTTCDALNVATGGCPEVSTRTPTVDALHLATGLSAELRLGTRFTVRGLAGVRILTNPADIRAMDDLTRRPRCENTASDADVCGLHVDFSRAPTANPLLAIDLGYTF